MEKCELTKRKTLLKTLIILCMLLNAVSGLVIKDVLSVALLSSKIELFERYYNLFSEKEI